MSRKSFTVLADDLTGACEIAAIGHGSGLRSVVSMSQHLVDESADLVVYDSETRLCGKEAAAAAVRELAGRINERSDTRFLFKKTDSVMRGPIAAEVCTLMRTLDLRRCILVPANPHLGRTIEDGVYYIDGIPLDRTSFAEDLHHPAQSALVEQLLGPVHGFSVHSAKPGQSLPKEGIIIGDARSTEDLLQWAGTWDKQTLMAGGGALFQALVKTLNRWSGEWTQTPFKPAGHLLVSGTTITGQQVFLDKLADSGIFAVNGSTDDTSANAGARWGQEMARNCGTANGCLLRMQRESSPDPAKAAWVRTQLALAAKSALESADIEHLIVEGGATAAAIASQLDWRSFEVRHIWGPGIVTLRPLGAQNRYFTIKPGSYPWPEPFIKEIWPMLPSSKSPTNQ